jgi:AcrR family transcriptional regulator
MPPSRPRTTVAASEADLTASARIRNAALDLFAERGVSATTIRDVAAAAGVSPGLVQHHFGTKAALKEAVNQFVAADAAAVVTDLPPADLERRRAVFGARMGAVVRERPTAMLYMARLVIEGDEAGLAMFRAITEMGTEELRELQRSGQLDQGLDLEWLSLHFVVFNLGTLLFEPAITRTLGEPLLSEAGIERWVAAAADTFTRAMTPTGKKR